MALQDEIKDLLQAGYPETKKHIWAVYTEDLNTGLSAVVNSQKMRAASLIKLYIMACFLDKRPCPTAEESAFLQQMITVSSNDAANRLVLLLGEGDYGIGLEAVNAWVRANRFLDTSQGRRLRDIETGPTEGENYTSVTDCGMFLKRLYQKNLISRTADGLMQELLLGQTLNCKIPAGLPDRTVCAHKTGELDAAQHDCAIIYAPFGDFILCVMSDGALDADSARRQIRELAAAVYKYFESMNR